MRELADSDEAAAQEVRRSLVWPASGISGFLACLPLLSALTAAGRHGVVVTTPRIAPLVDLGPGRPRALLATDKPTVAALRDSRCSEAFLLETSFASALRVRRAGITWRYGYRGGLRTLLLAAAVRQPATAATTDLATAAGLEQPDGQTLLCLDDVWSERGRERLVRADLEDDGQPRIGIYAGSQEGAPGAVWPQKRFEELLRQLRRRHPKWRFLLLATQEELWNAVKIFEATARLHPVIGPDLDLATLAAVLAELDLFFSCDSWMLRLAAASGTATVGLYEVGRRPPTEHAGLHDTVATIDVEAVVEHIEAELSTVPLNLTT